MSKSIFNMSDFEEVLLRIAKLTPNSQRLWGKMTINEMLCHTADQLRIATGEKSSVSQANFFNRTVVKWIVFNFNFPKNAMTIKELDKDQEGTQVESFEKDKATLLQLIHQVVKIKTLPIHPFFGELDHNEWGILVYKHLNHHLNQFGV
jgi:hypothetical protein